VNGGFELPDVFEILRQTLPPMFAGPLIDKLTGNAFRWETIQNQRSLRQWPPECFTRVGAGGSPTIVLRDAFLEAAEARAKEAADRRIAKTKPQSRAGRTRSSRTASYPTDPVPLTAAATSESAD
jgi:hypothetical protein